MFRMQVWQWVVVGLVALACVAAMGLTVARMFARKAETTATLREATAFESAAVGGVRPQGASAYDGFSYRVPARFAGRVRAVIDHGVVSVAGPRVSAPLYEGWIWVQAIVLALVPAVVVAAIVKLDWRWLALAVAVFAAQFAFSSVGAGIWPGLGELDWLAAGRFKAIEFPVASVSGVKIGPGWAEGGIDLVLLPVKGGIDAMSTGRAVSFFAPDEHGHEVRYAIHVPSDSDASRLAAELAH